MTAKDPSRENLGNEKNPQIKQVPIQIRIN
jgi:hypothetical protein